jgi:hypothetical protein
MLQPTMPGARPDLDLLRGAIDMHAHTHPALFRRPIDDADLAKIGLEYGMRGYVLKDHDSQTAGRAYHVRKMFADQPIEPIGAVVLNRSAGGLDPYVAESAIHYGARVVWMPSNHSKWHSDYFGISDYPQLGRPKRQMAGEGLTVLDGEGKLKPEVRTIVQVVADAGVCLATGHLSVDEIRALQDAANEAGVEKFIVTHANWALCKLDLDVQKELIAKGAYLEYVAVSCVSPIFWEQNPHELAGWISELGGEKLVLSSDLGQLSAPPHPEGMRMLVASLLDEGVAYEHLERMLQHNPAVLLDLPT